MRRGILYNCCVAKYRIVFASALLIGAGCALGAGDDLPSAETILDRFVEVTGGRAAYQKRHSDYVVADVEQPGAPAKIALVKYHQAPDKSYSEMSMAGFGKVRMGTDGRTAWIIPPTGTPMVLEGEAREMALIGARLNGEIEWRELYRRVETVGSEEVDGKPAYIVVKTPKQAKPVTEYYDAESHLLVKYVVKGEPAMGDVRVETLVSDYREEGGILIAHKLVLKGGGQEHVITIRTVKINQEAPPGTFDIPAEVQALLDKK